MFIYLLSVVCMNDIQICPVFMLYTCILEQTVCKIVPLEHVGVLYMRIFKICDLSQPLSEPLHQSSASIMANLYLFVFVKMYECVGLRLIFKLQVVRLVSTWDLHIIYYIICR